MGPIPVPAWIRVLRRVTVDPESGCWLWTGPTNKGYAQVEDRHADGRRRNRHGHVVVYEYIIGVVPDDLELDHLCRVRRCVNPAHMEPVTSGVNTRRGSGVTAQKSRQTRCERGHQFDYVSAQGRRVCRTCRNRRKREHRRSRSVEWAP